MARAPGLQAGEPEVTSAWMELQRRACEAVAVDLDVGRAVGHHSVDLACLALACLALASALLLVLGVWARVQVNYHAGQKRLVPMLSAGGCRSGRA
mmetsp:Transcript_104110/g.261027  ORF Transcript_104110/g.261027 Transcript_104110/m.261027 type:complete len:96 (-) Transcript_104110:120-407(-)